MTSDDRSALQFRRMTETPIPQLVLSLAAPTILSMLITSIYNLAEGQCPVGAISMGEGKFEIDAAKCVDCGSCAGQCPVGAISEG